MLHTDKTLGQLLESVNDTVRRNAMSILKQLQRKKDDNVCRYCGDNMYGEIRVHHHTEIIGGKEVDVTS